MRPRLPIIGTAIVTALVVAPLAALAANDFDDVDPTDVHAPGIAFLKDNGVTVGCGDGSSFCPGDDVTRAQMATFMKRLAESGAVLPNTAAVQAIVIDFTSDVVADATAAAEAAAADTVADLRAGIVADATAAAAQAAASAPGAVVAQGQVDNLGTLTSPTGVTDVDALGSGLYCITLDPALDVTREEVYAHVTVEWWGSAGDDHLASYDAGGANCAGEQLQIRTFNIDGGVSPENVGFVFTVHRR